jgi:hypothetical protein
MILIAVVVREAAIALIELQLHEERRVLLTYYCVRIWHKLLIL